MRRADLGGRGRKPAFPPQQVALVQALACEIPAQREQPLRRDSTADLARLIAAHPDRPALSTRTLWRIRDAAARKPWRQQGWRFPRDPAFAGKAGRALDLDAGWWDGQPLDPEDCVLSADEQTRIQARVRRRATTPARPGQALRVEHAYARGGALASLAAGDVRRGGVSGRGEATTGRAPFGRLVAQVRQQEPDRAAPRVVWVVDHGSRHRGPAAAERLRARYPTLVLVQLPTPASWRKQIAIFFAIIQRKVLTPNDCPALAAIEARLAAFEARDHDPAVPCHWRFTRQDLDDRLAALPALPPPRLDPAPPPTADQAIAA